MKKARYRDFEGFKLQMRSERLEVRNEKINVSEQCDTSDVRKSAITQAGITLVALVVTIVVLLILAGITITYVFSDNGILSRAQDATSETDSATVLEEIQQKLLAIQAGNEGSYSNGDVQTVVAAVTGKEKDDIEIGVKTVTTENGNEINISSLWVGIVSTTASYVGYYADVDGNGSVDGIIFADLMIAEENSPWGTGNTTFGTYSWTVLTESDGVKSYYVSQESYTDDFGTKAVISPASGTTGEDRFYVMALSDIDSSSHYWYYSAYSYGMSDYEYATSGDFGSGYKNTETMISYWNNKKYGTQNGGSSYTDMWGLDAVQTGYENGWFVPSRGEWAAFAGQLGITSSNYSSTYRS